MVYWLNYRTKCPGVADFCYFWHHSYEVNLISMKHWVYPSPTDPEWTIVGEARVLHTTKHLHSGTFVFNCVMFMFRSKGLGNSVSFLSRVLRKKNTGAEASTPNINMTQSKTKVLERRCFVVCLRISCILSTSQQWSSRKVMHDVHSSKKIGERIRRIPFHGVAALRAFGIEEGNAFRDCIDSLLIDLEG